MAALILLKSEGIPITGLFFRDNMASHMRPFTDWPGTGQARFLTSAMTDRAVLPPKIDHSDYLESYIMLRLTVSYSAIVQRF